MANSAITQADARLYDDLKVIPGISGKMEKRLNDAGIATYARLAEATPAELLAALKGMPGYNIERVRSDDWVGQARRLDEAQRRQLAEMPAQQDLSNGLDENHSLPAERLPYESFMIQFSLDSNDHVRRINVHNVQKHDDKKQWTHWVPGELAEFFERSGRLALTYPTPAASGVAADTPLVSPAYRLETAKRRDEPGKITVLDWRIMVGDKLVKRLVAANQPFDFQLDIYFNPAQFTAGEPLSCNVNLYARNAKDGSRISIGNGQETLNFDEGAEETLAGAVHTTHTEAVLEEPGTYHMEAAVLVRPLNPGLDLKKQAAGLLEGIFVQTYDAS